MADKPARTNATTPPLRPGSVHLDQRDRGRGLLLLGLSLGYFMVLLDTTIVTVALPAISRSFSSGLSSLQWVSNGYTLTFAALLLTAGVLSDRFGGRRVFLVGLVAFGLISCVSAAADSIGMLIGLRALLGIAGAMLLPTSLAVIAHAYTDPGARARALGTWAAITGSALVAGPVVGGVLTDAFGWRSIFLLNGPVALVSIVLTARYAPKTAPKGTGGVDLAGQAAAIVALAALTYGLIQSGSAGWGDPTVLGSFILFLVAAVTFVMVERPGATGRRAPMLPLEMFRNRTFSAGLLAGMLVNFGLTGILFVLSLYFQRTRGYSAFVAGMAFIPLTLPTAFNPIFTGRLVAKVGPRMPSLVGFLLMAAGSLVQAPFSGGSASDVAVTTVGLLVLGFGVSFAIPSLLAGVVGAVPKEQAGIGAGALNSSRQTGAVLGVAILGAVLNGASSTARGTQLALVVAGVMLLAGAAVVAAYVGRPSRAATAPFPASSTPAARGGRADDTSRSATPTR